MTTTVRQIRESIELPTLDIGNAPVTIVQRQINLVDKVQHNLLNCETFFDNLLIDDKGAPFEGVMEILVTPYPVIYTDSTIIGLPFRAPSASQEGVLYKAVINGGGYRWPIGGDDFPNKFASFENEFDFYHPNLYITLLFHTSNQITLTDIAISFMFTVSQKTTSSLTHSLGLLKESMSLMTMTIAAMGRNIPYARNVGQIAPHWRWGGARPELMVDANTLLDFWITNGNNEAEVVGTPTELRKIIKDSRQMVENPDAFGTVQTGAGDIPDWIGFLTQEGYVSGAVREQWPPLKHADNGNVLTF